MHLAYQVGIVLPEGELMQLHAGCFRIKAAQLTRIVSPTACRLLLSHTVVGKYQHRRAVLDVLVRVCPSSARANSSVSVL